MTSPVVLPFKLNCRRPAQVAGAMSVVQTVDFSKFLVPSTTSAPVLPFQVSLRKDFPVIMDQGPQGDGTSFVIASLCQYALKSLRLSPQWLHYIVRKARGQVGQDIGSSVTDNVMIACSHGICSERAWPYDMTKRDIVPPQSCFDQALCYKLLRKSQVTQTLQSLKHCLHAMWPVACGFTIYPSFLLSKSNGGIVSMPDLTKEQPIGGHAFTLIGYDDKKSCFEVRTTFGDKWGDQGCVWVPYDYVTTSLAWDFWQVNAIEDSTILMPLTPPLAIPTPPQPPPVVIPPPIVAPPVVIPPPVVAPPAVVAPPVVFPPSNVVGLLPEVWMITSNINNSHLVEGQLQTPDMNMKTTMDFVIHIRRQSGHAFIVLVETSILTQDQINQLTLVGVNRIVSLGYSLVLNMVKVLTPLKGAESASKIAETYAFYRGMMDLLSMEMTCKSVNFYTGTFRMTLASNENGKGSLGWSLKPSTGTYWRDRYTWMSNSFDSYTREITNA